MIRKIPQDTEYFRFHNANPKGHRAGDCVYRAIATSTGKTWDEVLDGLVEVAHKYKYPVDVPECYGRYLESLGYSKMKQPRKPDNTKYTGEEFCKYLIRNRLYSGYDIVAHIGGHHIVAIDRAQVVDTWNSTDGTIGNYWIRRRQ